MADIDVGKITEALNNKMDRDFGNFNANEKANIVDWGMPNYNAGVSFSTNSNYTVPSVGIIVWNGSNSDQHSQTIKINDITIISHANNAGYDAFVGFLPVRKGDVVLITIGTQGSSTNKFYPMKGV